MFWKLRRQNRKILSFLFALLVVAFSTTCVPVKSAKNGISNSPTIAPGHPNTAPQAHDPGALCERIGDIKVLSFHPEDAEDPVYLDMVRAGGSMVPCLIEKITDETPTPDPREAPINDTTIGDIAYFVIVRITDLHFIEMLPDTVKRQYKIEGVNAYFRYVSSSKHRVELRDRLRYWYTNTYDHLKRTP